MRIPLNELKRIIREELVRLHEGYVPKHGLKLVDMRELMSDETIAREQKRDAEIEAMRVERERLERRPLTAGEIRGLEMQWEREYNKSMPTIVQKLKELEPRYRMEAEKRSAATARATGQRPPDQDTVVVPFAGQTFGLERFFVPSNKPEGPKYVMVSRLVKYRNNDGFVMAKDVDGQWKWHWAPPPTSMSDRPAADWALNAERGMSAPAPAAARRGERVQAARDAVAPPVIRRRRDEETGEVTGHTPVRTSGRNLQPKEVIDDYTGYVIGHRDPKTGKLIRPDDWAEIQKKIKNAR